MSQSNLFVDLGNSAVKWRSHDSEVFTQSVDIFTPSSLPKADSVWLSAVAHQSIAESIKAEFTNTKLVKPSKQFGRLTIAYEEPLSLGADRFLAMLGAINFFPRTPLLIIDVGSAVTFDVIDGTGMHQGGLIMPGIKSLRGSFAKFSTNDLSLNSSTLQSNTKGAWQGGTHAMLVSAINGQIQNFKVSYPDAEVLVCGGTAKEILNELPDSINHHDNLVLDGLESYCQSMG